jgi:PPM family protein phosphatase
MKFKLSAISDQGRRRIRNEDSVWCCPDLASPKPIAACNDFVMVPSERGTILAIADGIGGANAGDLASKLVMKFLEDYVVSNPLIGNQEIEIKSYFYKVMVGANTYLSAYANAHPETSSMGTTLVLAWIVSKQLYVTWIGDSRCYIHNPQQGLQLLTEDHTKAWQQYQQGVIDRHALQHHPESHILSQYLGDRAPAPEPGFLMQTLNPGQRILLCSDGLHGMISDDEIGLRLAAAYRSSDVMMALLEDALAAGGSDNVSMVLVDVLSAKEGSA